MNWLSRAFSFLIGDHHDHKLPASTTFHSFHSRTTSVHSVAGRRGFALVVTLSLMILLKVIASTRWPVPNGNRSYVIFLTGPNGKTIYFEDLARRLKSNIQNPNRPVSSL